MSTDKSNNPHYEAKHSPSPLELADGQKRMEIKPYDLSIVWGKDSRYWNVPEDGKPAELFQVSWLEVTGCVSKTDPAKEYEVGFNISLTPDAFGWSGSPVYILVKRGKTGKFKGHKFTLESPKEKSDIKAKVVKLENVRTGDAENGRTGDAENGRTGDADENSKVYFGFYEVWRGKWKGGLKIHHAFIQET